MTPAETTKRLQAQIDRIHQQHQAKRKQRLTVAEHEALGERLQRLQEELRAIGTIIEQAFPVQRGDRWARDSRRLLDHRSWLESELIQAMQAEGLDDGSVPKVYYRGQSAYRGCRE